MPVGSVHTRISLTRLPVLWGLVQVPAAVVQVVEFALVGQD